MTQYGGDRSGRGSRSEAPRLRPLRQTETLSDRTTELLRERIISGDFKMGARLAEATIARQLQISRGPVREALKQLLAEGLVREEPRRGFFVVELSVEDIREIYDVRAAIEARAARLIVTNRDTNALEELRAVLEQLRSAAKAGDHHLFTQLDLNFHEQLCLLSSNSRLHHIFVGYASALRILFRVELDEMNLSLDYLIEEHQNMFESIASFDVGRAERGCNEFMERAREGLIEQLGDTEARKDRGSSTA